MSDAQRVAAKKVYGLIKLASDIDGGDPIELIIVALTAARIEGERAGLERAREIVTKHADWMQSRSIANILIELDALAKELPHDHD